MTLSVVEHLDKDLEARKHLWFGLKRLDERQRVAFLKACCLLSKTNGQGLEARVTASKGHLDEVYKDLLLLAVGYRVSIGTMCALLERWLKKV